MKKSLYFFGGLMILFVAFDLTNRAGALATVTFDAMLSNFGQAAPESVSLVAYVALHMILLALGLALTCIGPLRQSDLHSVTNGGRLMHGAGGVAIIATSLICLFVLNNVRSAYMDLTVADANFGTVADALRAAGESAAATIRSAFMILGTAGGLTTLAALIGLQRIPPAEGEMARQPLRANVQMLTVLVAVAMATTLFLMVPHVGALMRLLENAEAAPKPNELGEQLLGIANKSLISFGLLGGLGLLQIVTALVAPRVGDVEWIDVDEIDDYEGDEGDLEESAVDEDYDDESAATADDKDATADDDAETNR